MSEAHEEIRSVDYRTSDGVNEIFAALAKAQGDIKHASKDSENPHFKSRYADLAAIVEACREPLSKNGLAVVQVPHNIGRDIAITTILGHSSGQWISGTIAVAPTRWDAQSLGSVTTYLRRYSLAAMTGVAPAGDDDGEGAVGRGNGTSDTVAPPSRTRGITRTAGAPERGTAPPGYGNGVNKAALPASPEETPEITAARHRIRMLIDKIDSVIKTAPHKQALEVSLDDAREELTEIEAAGENGKNAAMELRRKANIRLSRFDEPAEPELIR